MANKIHTLHISWFNTILTLSRIRGRSKTITLYYDKRAFHTAYLCRQSYYNDNDNDNDDDDDDDDGNCNDNDNDNWITTTIQ